MVAIEESFLISIIWIQIICKSQLRFEKNGQFGQLRGKITNKKNKNGELLILIRLQQKVLEGIFETT